MEKIIKGKYVWVTTEDVCGTRTHTNGNPPVYKSVQVPGHLDGGRWRLQLKTVWAYFLYKIFN